MLFNGEPRNWSKYRFPKERCPFCRGKMTARELKEGWFLVCLRFPTCKGKRPTRDRRKAPSGELKRYPPLRMEWPPYPPVPFNYAMECLRVAIANLRHFGLFEDANSINLERTKLSEGDGEGRDALERAVEAMRDCYRVFRDNGHTSEANLLASRGKYLVQSEGYRT